MSRWSPLAIGASCVLAPPLVFVARFAWANVLDPSLGTLLMPHFFIYLTLVVLGIVVGSIQAGVVLLVLGLIPRLRAYVPRAATIVAAAVSLNFIYWSVISGDPWSWGLAMGLVVGALALVLEVILRAWVCRFRSNQTPTSLT
jgi:hypothetical protein